MPLLQKNARGSPDRFASRSASCPCSGWIEQVRGVDQRLGLLRDRARQAADARGRATRRRCPTAGRVFAALGVVETHALAAHERDRRAAIGLQHMPRFARLTYRRAITSSSCRRDHPLSYVRVAATRRRRRVCRRRLQAPSSIPAVDDHHVVDAAGRARARTRAAWRSCRRWPCRRPPAARSPSASSTGIVAPPASSTPGVVPGDDQPPRAAAAPPGARRTCRR